MTPWQAAVIAALVIGGALLMLVSAVSMLRERDAMSRINALSPATGMGLPLIVFGAYLHELWTDGFTVQSLIQLLITWAALLVVSSVASNVLGRAAYLSGAPVHPDTNPNELAREPD